MKLNIYKDIVEREYNECYTSNGNFSKGEQNMNNIHNLIQPYNLDNFSSEEEFKQYKKDTITLTKKKDVIKCLSNFARKSSREVSNYIYSLINNDKISNKIQIVSDRSFRNTSLFISNDKVSFILYGDSRDKNISLENSISILEENAITIFITFNFKVEVTPFKKEYIQSLMANPDMLKKFLNNQINNVKENRDIYFFKVNNILQGF